MIQRMGTDRQYNARSTNARMDASITKIHRLADERCVLTAIMIDLDDKRSAVNATVQVSQFRDGIESRRLQVASDLHEVTDRVDELETDLAQIVENLKEEARRHRRQRPASPCHAAGFPGRDVACHEQYWW